MKRSFTTGCSLILIGIIAFLFSPYVLANNNSPGSHPRIDKIKERISERLEKKRLMIKQKIRNRLDKKLDSYKKLTPQQKVIICQRILKKVEEYLQNENLTPENTLLFMILQEVLKDKIQSLAPK